MTKLRAHRIALVLVGVAAAHLWFIAFDDRLPRDLSFAYNDLEPAGAALVAGRWEFFFDILAQPAGWLNVSLAVVFEVLGRSPRLFRLFDVGWLMLLLGSSVRIARSLGGERAALSTVLLLAGMPLAVVLARLSWIHLPEAALLTAAAAVAVRDPELTRWRSLLGVAALTGAALLLRPSALVWAVGLCPLLFRAPWRRLAILVAVLAVSALPALGDLAPYLAGKLEVRERYAEQVEPLWVQLDVLVGLWTGVPAVIGAGLWLRSRPSPAPLGFLAVWALGPVAVWAVFRAGLENFLVLAPALALAGGLGLARHRHGVLLSALGAGLLWTVQFVPTGPAEAIWGRLPGTTPGWYRESLLDLYRPWSGYGAGEVRDLLDATCPSAEPRRCLVVVEDGLFHPDPEDPGRLGLFLMHEDRVDLRIAHQDRGPLPGAAAVVRFACAGRTAGEPVDLPDLRVVWSRDVGQDCTVAWWVPGGRLVRPDSLPAPHPGRLSAPRELQAPER